MCILWEGSLMTMKEIEKKLKQVKKKFEEYKKQDSWYARKDVEAKRR